MTNGNKITLTLLKKPELDVEGKEIRDANNNIAYSQHDILVVNQLIKTINSTDLLEHEYKPLLCLEDKFKQAWLEDLDEISLNIDECALLKKIMKEVPVKSELKSFHLRTIINLEEQLK